MTELATAERGTNIRPHDLAVERVDDLTRRANEWLGEVPEIFDETTEKRARDFLDQITKELRRLDAEETAEKKPLRDQIAAIGRSYTPLTTALDVIKDLINPKMAKWLNRKQAALDAEKERQREQAAELARIAHEAARKLERGKATVEQTVFARVAAERATEMAQLAAAPPERAQVRGDYSSRALSIRKLWRAEIVDDLQAYVYYADHSDVRATLQRLANAEAPAAHKQGREIPGCKLVAKEVTA